MRLRAGFDTGSSPPACGNCRRTPEGSGHNNARFHQRRRNPPVIMASYDSMSRSLASAALNFSSVMA